MKSLSNIFIGIFALLALSGCADLFSTTGENYAGVNYGELITPDGERWKIAGGKDGTNVQFDAVTRPDGTREVHLSADNYDATTVLAQSNKALAERLTSMTDLLMSLAAPKP